MKNLTEFSGVILRQAAAVRSTKLAELKANAKAAPEATAPEAETAPVVAEDPNGAIASADATAEVSAEADAPAEATEAPAEAPAEATPVEAAETPAEAAPVEAAAEEKPAEAPAAEEKPAEARIDDEALAAAVGEEMGMEGDKVGYLMGALKAVGRKGLDQVRKVRVFQGEQGPAGSFSIGDLHFVVDRIVVASKSKDDRDGKGRGGKGRGGKGRGQGRGGPGGGGSGFGGGASVPKGGSGFDVMSKDESIGDVSGGLGWSLAKTPGGAKKEGRGRGKPGRKGPRRGKPGAKPGEDRNRNRNRNRKPRTDSGAAKAPEVTVKAPMVPAGKPAAAPKPAVETKPVDAPKTEA